MLTSLMCLCEVGMKILFMLGGTAWRLIPWLKPLLKSNFEPLDNSNSFTDKSRRLVRLFWLLDLLFCAYNPRLPSCVILVCAGPASGDSVFFWLLDIMPTRTAWSNHMLMSQGMPCAWLSLSHMMFLLFHPCKHVQNKQAWQCKNSRFSISYYMS